MRVVVYEDVAGGGVRRGKVEIKRVLAAAFAFAPDFRPTLTSLAMSGDTGTTQWKIEGTPTGPTPVGSIGDLPATGRTLRLRGASVLLLRGGKIARVTGSYDMATLRRQLGGTFLAPKR
jgi:predicted ester cyclase